MHSSSTTELFIQAWRSRRNSSMVYFPFDFRHSLSVAVVCASANDAINAMKARPINPRASMSNSTTPPWRDSTDYSRAPAGCSDASAHRRQGLHQRQRELALIVASPIASAAAELGDSGPSLSRLQGPALDSPATSQVRVSGRRASLNEPAAVYRPLSAQDEAGQRVGALG